MKRLLILLVLLCNGKTIRCAIEGSLMIVNIAWYKGIDLSYKNIIQQIRIA